MNLGVNEIGSVAVGNLDGVDLADLIVVGVQGVGTRGAAKGR
jgi:hypothetical protein